jgi:hypothetical protein
MRRQEKMRRTVYAACSLVLLLSACALDPVVTGDGRGFFDTTKGMYGGNEFDARSTEGKVEYGRPAPAVAAPAAAPAAASPAAPAAAAPALAAVPSPPPLTLAAAAAPAPAPPTHIGIDPNAFAAVFGPSTAPVQPTAEQLMQLDSLSLVAGEGMRAELQKKILACRRAGAGCRLASQ